MVLKTLLRRKGRTLLTVLGISIGVAAIVILGALTNGLEAGYSSMMTGSKSDLILSQPNSMDPSYSSVDEEIGQQLEAMPEVEAVSSMLEGFVAAEKTPVLFIFGYPEDSFILKRFQILQGVGLSDASLRKLRGKPLLLGKGAADTLKKSPGDTLRLTDSLFRVAGIYQTGDAFEDNGAVLRMEDAQDLLGKARQVSMFYIQLKDPDLEQRLTRRVERTWSDLSIDSSSDFASKQSMTEMMGAMVWIIAGLAIVIGGVGMMNAQLMSIYERTREIGVLRAVGWSSASVLWMVLGESIIVCLIGGLVGTGLGWLAITLLSRSTVLMGLSTNGIDAGLLVQALSVVVILGLMGGLYPAWRASRLRPIEALRYEGGTSGSRIHRLPIGGMAIQGLWQRSTRTLLTLLVIGITVGSIMSLDAVIVSFKDTFTNMMSGADAQLVLWQDDVADTTMSALDERIGEKLNAMPEIEAANGMIFTAVMLPETNNFFFLEGYDPNGFAIRRFEIIAGKSLNANRQIILGSMMASTMNKDVGDSIELGGSRFRVVGIYKSSAGWEELGGVISLRDAQVFTGRPRKVTMYTIRLREPGQAREMASRLNKLFPDLQAGLSGEFVEQLPDMQNSDAMMNAISGMAVLVGGLGVLNTMLMSVLERTREIGVLRAMGWRRRSVLGLIMREALILGLGGGLVGILVAFLLAQLMYYAPGMEGMLEASWTLEIFARALSVALFLGLLGGIYPAYRATQMPPVEALRYE